MFHLKKKKKRIYNLLAITGALRTVASDTIDRLPGPSNQRIHQSSTNFCNHFREKLSLSMSSVSYCVTGSTTMPSSTVAYSVVVEQKKYAELVINKIGREIRTNCFSISHLYVAIIMSSEFRTRNIEYGCEDRKKAMN